MLILKLGMALVQVAMNRHEVWLRSEDGSLFLNGGLEEEKSTEHKWDTLI